MFDLKSELCLKFRRIWARQLLFEARPTIYLMIWLLTILEQFPLSYVEDLQSARLCMYPSQYPRGMGLNISPANHGGWLGAFSSSWQFHCIDVVHLSSKTSHWHEKVRYQLSQPFVIVNSLPLGLTVSSIASYYIASTLVPSRRKPTANDVPTITRALMFHRFFAILVIIMASGHPSRWFVSQLTSTSSSPYQQLWRSLVLSKFRANVCDSVAIVESTDHSMQSMQYHFWRRACHGLDPLCLSWKHPIV